MAGTFLTSILSKFPLIRPISCSSYIHEEEGKMMLYIYASMCVLVYVLCYVCACVCAVLFVIVCI